MKIGPSPFYVAWGHIVESPSAMEILAEYTIDYQPGRRAPLSGSQLDLEIDTLRYVTDIDPCPTTGVSVTDAGCRGNPGDGTWRRLAQEGGYTFRPYQRE